MSCANFLIRPFSLCNCRGFENRVKSQIFPHSLFRKTCRRAMHPVAWKRSRLLKLGAVAAVILFILFCIIRSTSIDSPSWGVKSSEKLVNRNKLLPKKYIVHTALHFQCS